jgi:hypothetical protein
MDRERSGQASFQISKIGFVLR